MVQPTIGRVLTDMEREIEAEVRNRSPAPPRVGSPDIAMPDYVEHRDGATEIGKLSAEGVVREYEAAAKEIEAMGAELTALAKHCEATTRDALAVIDELKETAGRYREEAKRVFLQIENCSLLMAEVRKTCAELKEKIAVRATTDTKAKKK
jgi:phosphoglycolate phosphatase-like HAD superfamily hydrolase